MPWWWWFACTEPDAPTESVDTDVVVDSPTVDSDADDRAWLEQPPEAADLDEDPDVVHVQLTAAPFVHDIGGEAVEGYAYSGSTPGPTLRGEVGDTLIVELQNDLPDATTIHWHGLEVPYDMDGVTWQRDPVAAGGSFTYSFTLTKAGTYWYHPHFDSNEQVSRGLYGVLVVEDPSDPAPAQELILVLDDWLLAELADDEGVHGDHGLEGVWTSNGQISPRWEAPDGVTRVRILNASNAGYVKLAWPSMRVLGTERGIGGGLTTPDSLVLGPGDRAEAEWLGGDFLVEDHPYSLHGGEAYGEVAEVLLVEGAALDDDGLAWPFHGEAPTPDPGRTDIVYVFSGDAGEWFINGEQFPDVTIEELILGDEVVIEVRNLSPTRHPFHLHGLTFEVLSSAGTPPAWRSRQDTVDVGVHEAVRLLVTANNPGDWMTHCHILPHAEQGMMTVLRVAE